MTGCTGKTKEVKLHEEYEHDSEPKARMEVIEPEPMFFYAPQSDAAETIEIMPFFIPEDIASDGRCASCEEMEEKNGMLSAYHTGRANVNEERVPQNVRAAIINYAIATGVGQDAVYEDNFKYALYVDSDGDMHHRNAGYIEELYEIPYNLYDYDPQTDGGTKAPESISSDAYGFMTNREMTEQYGGIFAMSCVDDAKEYIKAVYSYDYTDPFVMQMHAEKWAELTRRSPELDAFATSKIEEAKKNEMQTDAHLLTNDGLVYQDAECNIRVRGMRIMRYNSIANHTAMENGIAVGGIYFTPVEVVLRLRNGYLDVTDEIELAPQQRTHKRREAKYGEYLNNKS